MKRNDDRLYTFTDFSIYLKVKNAPSENCSPHCGTYTEKGWGILTAAIQGEGEKMIYQQEGNIKA